MMRHSHRFQVRILLILAASIGLSPAAAPAQESEYSERPHLSDGPWLGTGVLEGPVRLEFPTPAGVGHVTYNWRLEGVFHLQVEDGSVSGEVILDGDVETTGGGAPGMTMHGTGDLSGTGTADGTAYGFHFAGTVGGRDEGYARVGPVVTEMGGSGDIPVEIEVTITDANCTDVRGEWTQDWKALFREWFEKELRGSGVYSDDLRGEFVATRQDEAVRQALRDYIDRVRPLAWETEAELPPLEQEEGEVGEVPPDAKAVVEGWAQLVADFNRQMVDDWDPASPYGRDQAFALTARALQLLEELLDDECTAELLDEERVDKIRNSLAALFRRATKRILEWSETNDTPLSGHNIEGLVERGIALDAFDPPADAPEADAERARAKEIELGLQQQAERLLEETLPPPRLMLEDDPVLNLENLSDDATAALRAGAERGWSFELYGERYWADNLLEQVAGR